MHKEEKDTKSDRSKRDLASWFVQWMKHKWLPTVQLLCFAQGSPLRKVTARVRLTMALTLLRRAAVFKASNTNYDSNNERSPTKIISRGRAPEVNMLQQNWPSFTFLIQQLFHMAWDGKQKLGICASLSPVIRSVFIWITQILFRAWSPKGLFRRPTFSSLECKVSQHIQASKQAVHLYGKHHWQFHIVSLPFFPGKGNLGINQSLSISNHKD